MLKKYTIKNKKIFNNEKGNIFYFYNLNENEKNEIVKNFGIDINTINSALDPEEPARFEIEKEDNINIIWKMPVFFKIDINPSLNILSAGFFIREKNLFIISIGDCFDFEKINEKNSFEIKSIFDIVIILQNYTIKKFIENLKMIKLISRDIEKEINTSLGNESLLQMFYLSELLIYYIDAINGNKTVLNKFNTYIKNNKIEINNIDFLNDLIIENEQACRQAEIYSQVFAGLMDARGNIINNNMNILIKKLTIINVVFLPLSLIAGIGGMSEFTMMTEGIPWPISYGIFSIFMIIIGIILFLIINKITNKNTINKNLY